MTDLWIDMITPEQKELIFWEIAGGMFLGLNTVYECVASAYRPMAIDYMKLGEHVQAQNEAWTAFLRIIYDGPCEPGEEFTDDQLWGMFNARAELERNRAKALMFYASERNWEDGTISADHGRTARAAIGYRGIEKFDIERADLAE